MVSNTGHLVTRREENTPFVSDSMQQDMPSDVRELPSVDGENESVVGFQNTFACGSGN